MASLPSLEHFDVLIVGAGLSGIGAGYHLQSQCPRRSYAILEARDSSGGTWDLFRYPGVRCDSDMYTLGYSFRPWQRTESIADGASILEYIRAAASDYGIDRRIRFNHRVKRAAWSTLQARWSVEVERRRHADDTPQTVHFTCNFLFICSGYYSYAGGYTPKFPGQETFGGRIVHPQQWTDDIEYAGKRVVVIGSGATAITLVPQLAKRAAHVTMLQRSPTYVMSMPVHDRIANRLRRWLPAKAAHGITRWKNVLVGMIFFRLSKRAPVLIRKLLLDGVRRQLDPDYDVATHFTPRYNPWDQRLCLAADGDLFAAINSGRVTVVTDRIDSLTANGIRLTSGRQLDADIVVTATGLNLMLLGGVQLEVDGRRVDLSRTMSYKGMMYSDLPNLAAAVGYTNASWTLKCELTCQYVCRLLNYMDKHGQQQCTPRNRDPSITQRPLIDFSSGYIQRSIQYAPKQGSRAPWKLRQNHVRNFIELHFGRLDDDVLEFACATASMDNERRATGDG